MCGITGYYCTEGPFLDSFLETMTESLAHRGPNDLGMWFAPSRHAGFGHTRLAIVDLDGGGQPMATADGRMSIVFNGEIYNYTEIRKTLEDVGVSFRSASDTEVLLESYRHWGSKCLDRLKGMFAFAIYDGHDKSLFMARDRVGIKPLYYYNGPEGLLFGSEIKSIATVSHLPRRLDYNALADYFVFGYPLVPRTFFQNIYELLPGTWVHATYDGKLERGSFWNWKWSKDQVIDIGEALSLTRKTLIESIENHLGADVPVGAFLSAGVDSSLLISIISRELGQKIDTFTVAFDEDKSDESALAAQSAKLLGTRHHTVPVADATASMELLSTIMSQFDQPFGDSSSIPSYLISSEISKYVRVVIGGDGGDEMFGGYPRFRLANWACRWKKVVGPLLPLTSKSFRLVKPLAPELYRKGSRMLRAIQSKNGDRLTSLSCYSYPDELCGVLRPEVTAQIFGYLPRLEDDSDTSEVNAAQFMSQTVRYALPGDYLRKVDVMSSAHGLEVRVPFLDNNVLSLSSRLHPNLHFSKNHTKPLLRRMLADYLPQEVINRPKTGFGIPLDRWFPQDMKESIGSELTSSNAPVQSLVRPEYIQEVLTAFISGHYDRAYYSRYMVYQKSFILWSLNLWMKQWRPTL